MSGVEIAVPVIAAVFALISAFKDGGTIAEKLKERRQRRGAQVPNARLHKALEQGVQEIQSSEREGVEDFGDAYNEDVATASKLKDVTIVLQDTIIKELAAAYQDDDMNDFAPAINSIVQARREAVNILNDHYLSLQKRRSQGLPLRKQQPKPVSPIFAARSTRTNTIDTMDTTVSDTSSSTRTQLHYHSPTESRLSIASGDPGLVTPQSPQPKTKSGKWRPFSRRTSTEKSIEIKQQPPSQQVQSPPLSNVITPEERRAHTPTNLLSSPTMSLGLPSPALRRISTANSTFEPSHAGMEVSSISEDNNYAGLCKCAYRAQKYQLSKAMESSMRDYEWMYHCKKCKYRLTADASQRGNPHFDDRIQTSASTLNFRCLFLWKSHLPIKDGQRRYSCLICLLTNRKSKTYVGEDQLFGHIIRHANEIMVMNPDNPVQARSVPLQGMIEVHSDGISPANMESFDIYFPLDLQPAPNRFSFPMLPESAIGNIDETGSEAGGSIRTSTGANAGVGIGIGIGIDMDSNTHTGTPMTRDNSNQNRYQSEPSNTGLLSPLPITRPVYEVHGESAHHRTPSRPESDFAGSSSYEERTWNPVRTRYAELDATGRH